MHDLITNGSVWCCAGSGSLAALVGALLTSSEEAAAFLAGILWEISADSGDSLPQFQQ